MPHSLLSIHTFYLLQANKNKVVSSDIPTMYYYVRLEYRQIKASLCSKIKADIVLFPGKQFSYHNTFKGLTLTFSARFLKIYNLGTLECPAESSGR